MIPVPTLLNKKRAQLSQLLFIADDLKIPSSFLHNLYIFA
jgi:hypothetical protein